MPVAEPVNLHERLQNTCVVYPLRQGREATVELVNYKKSGDKFWNLLSITPVRDAGGRLMSFIGVQSDITELILRKEAELELQEAKVAAGESVRHCCDVKASNTCNPLQEHLGTEVCHA